RLRVGPAGGGPVASALKRAWRDELRLPLVESYGQSELGGFMALGEPTLVAGDVLAPVGRPLPDKEVRVLDAGGKECAPGEVGEVCLRGGFMAGYWGKAEETGGTLRGGWVDSGGAGGMGWNGGLTVRGRVAELVTVAGRTWFTRAVQEALCGQPGVKEAAVIALPDAQLGQRPVAYVTLADGAVDLDKLKAAIAPLVPYDLTAMTVKSLAAFPMTPTGKIAKAQLRESAR